MKKERLSSFLFLAAYGRLNNESLGTPVIGSKTAVLPAAFEFSLVILLASIPLGQAFKFLIHRYTYLPIYSYRLT